MMIILVACSDDSSQDDVEASDLENLNESGMPIVEESIDLDIFTGKSLTNVKSDWNDILIWNEYEDMTNIHVEWRQIPGESLEEKRNLTFGGGELPDV